MNAIVLRADARALPLPDGCVDLVVTSPPFWQLRSYTDGGEHYDGQIGSERTWQEYIGSLLECTAEWIRVLKPCGSLFVELGDKYSDRGHGPSRGNGTGRGPQGTRLRQTRGPMEKSLLDLPHRYAIRAVDELGLIKRAEIIWNHTNGLPESVTDRVRRAHSVVFHLVKQPRYYAAIDEIREPATTAATDKRSDPARWAAGLGRSYHDHADDDIRGNRGGMKAFNPLGKLPGSVWSIPSQPLTVPPALGVDHFAAFPAELPRRIVLGWSPPGVCTACGQGRRPVTSDPAYIRLTRPHNQRNLPTCKTERNRDNNRSDASLPYGTSATKLTTITGYACACPRPTAPARPAIVLDPFAGTGTTLLAAAAYGRHAIGVDRSADYCRLARWRTADPGERARAMQVPKPPPVPDGQGALFEMDAAMGP